MLGDRNFMLNQAVLSSSSGAQRTMYKQNRTGRNIAIEALSTGDGSTNIGRNTFQTPMLFSGNSTATN